ncbi:hypothetical protein LZD49_32925 [Dyadobacter sp. CY261]|uniref:hypothetical protein n=1 Tax=Dyadobacter sp. CY261 TaxID=2907203 RepID=UPI001F300EA9|nr:hypothetical protein [Dyadobacter sp. CY261]MCF0075328.1 hypothetical protein [Dyadobacter sp. CY261]
MERQLTTGDFCSFLKEVSLHSSVPKFIVPVLPSKLVAICISTSLLKIRLDNKSVENVNDIVWTWNSGLKSGTISGGKLIVDYSEGKMVKDGVVGMSSKAEPLSSGGFYFFSMWSWDDQGKEIEYSSANIPFIVEKRFFKFPSLSFLIGNLAGTRYPFGSWKLQAATDAQSGLPITVTGVPNQLSFEFDSEACEAGSQEPYGYLEGNVFRSITFDGYNIDIQDSKLFVEKLEVLFVCESELQFRTVVRNLNVILTYSKI